MEAPIEKKAVNAFVPDADAGFIAKFVMKVTDTEVTETVLNQFKKAMGGLWVGGSAILYENRLSFHPNIINRVLHEGDYDLEIPLAEIKEVDIHLGMVTRIIDIVTDQGKFSMWCFGVKKFAHVIQNQVAAQNN